MPTAKIGQASHNQINDLQQKHWDVDMKIREVLDLASLEAKTKLATRISGLLDEINAELRATENDLNA